MEEDPGRVVERALGEGLRIGCEEERYGLRSSWRPDEAAPDDVRAAIGGRKALLQQQGLVCDYPFG